MKMRRIVFIYGVLLFLYFIFYGCEGAITSPPHETEYVFFPGETKKIIWEFDDFIPSLLVRAWYFTSSDGSTTERLASIAFNRSANIEARLIEVDIEWPATLVLKNVDQSYNGVYVFSLTANDQFTSEVTVYIAKKPNVTLNCSISTAINEGDSFTCVCRGEGGIPPANVTWYKDDKQIGEAGKEEQTLTVSHVNRTKSGIYTCIARVGFNKLVVEKTIEIKLTYKPNMPVITFTPEKAVVGIPVVVTCESEGVPEPSYTIVNNDTVVSNCKTYGIREMKWSDGGTYKCIVMNKLGKNSSFAKLIVEEEKVPPSIRTITEDNKTDIKLSNDNCTSYRTEWYIVVVSLVSGIIIGIFLSYIVWCSRRKFGSRKPQSIPEPQSQRNEVDTSYQELDLSQMNREDNYQSLKGNVGRNDAAVNDEDSTVSTYTELNKIRDVENKYQSLA